MKCERCGAPAQNGDFHDYCAECNKSLCQECMDEGCCGEVPALSGMEEDQDIEARKKQP